jgi:hypothetical protein
MTDPNIVPNIPLAIDWSAPEESPKPSRAQLIDNLDTAILHIAAWVRVNSDLLTQALRLGRVAFPERGSLTAASTETTMVEEMDELLAAWSKAGEEFHQDTSLPDPSPMADALLREQIDNAHLREQAAITNGIVSDVKAQLQTNEDALTALRLQLTEMQSNLLRAKRSLGQHVPFSIRDMIEGAVEDIDGLDVEKLMDSVKDHVESLDLDDFMLEREWLVTVTVKGTVKVTATSEMTALAAVKDMAQGDVVDELDVDDVEVEDAEVYS